jgi:hypothetical protein
MFVLLACGALQASKVVDSFWLNAGAGAMLILALGLLARPDRFAFRQIPFAAGVALAAISLLTLGFSVTRFLIKDRLPDNRDALLAAAFAMAVPFFVVNPDMLNVARRKYLKGLRNFFLEPQEPPLDGRAAPRPGPFPIINSFLQAPGSENDEVRQDGGDNFIVTPLHCGSRCTGYHDLSSWWRKGWRGTEKYYRLSDLVAASAAALDTRYVGQSKLASVLAVALNLGLGRWFLNPASEAPRGRWAWPSHFDNFITLFDSHAETARWIRLSDGGHYENLGLFELVARWSDVFVVVDAAHDPHYRYLDLYTATRLCRERLGATIEIPSLKPGRQHARDAYEGTITSAAGKVAKLHYLKLAVADHHRLELRTRASVDPLFPQEPTTNQFLDKDQMTAYFDLGKATATRIGPSLRADAFGKHPPTIHAAI